MGAGLAGSTVKTYGGGVNVNQIQYGDKLQGLPSVTNRRVGVNYHVRTKGGGHAPGRYRIFCINQLGGVGMRNKNSQFAPNADGLGWCPEGFGPPSFESRAVFGQPQQGGALGQGEDGCSVFTDGEYSIAETTAPNNPGEYSLGQGGAGWTLDCTDNTVNTLGLGELANGGVDKSVAINAMLGLPSVLVERATNGYPNNYVILANINFVDLILGTWAVAGTWSEGQGTLTGPINVRC